MIDLFQNLLVSAPNGGGLFLASDGTVFKLDNVDTVGLWPTGRGLLRGAQPATLWVHGAASPAATQVFEGIPDIHDVLEWGGYYYVIGTTKNEVLKLDFDGQVIHRWTFPGEDDSMHLNCLGVWNGRIVFSAFGDFSLHRGYKGMTQGAGFVQDLESGAKLVQGLSQPHSLVEFNGNLLVANSQCRELREYNPQGECVRTCVLDGYTRGICLVGDVIYIGLSRSRNIEEAGIPTATIVALDAATWEERGRVGLAASEIYSVVYLRDAAALLNVVSASVAHSAEVRFEQLQVARNSAKHFSETAEALAEQLGQKDELIAQLQAGLQAAQEALELRQQELLAKDELAARTTREYRDFQALREAELERLHASLSWRLSTPVRLAGRLARRDWRGLEVGVAQVGKILAHGGARMARLLRAARYAVNHYGSVGMAVSKTVELYRKHGLSGIRERAGALLLRNGEGGAQAMSSAVPDFYAKEVEAREDFIPLVTVIVPNYNHSAFLRERLDSIYAQTYTNIQVILLDDLSSDDSRAILTEYAERYPDTTQCAFNEVNSGGVFNQWKKGLSLARGELIWIAESDDYCTANFLAENVHNFSNEAVMLSYARSVFVTGTPAREVWSTEEYLSFLGFDFWQQAFTKSAHWLVNNCFALKNIVPNVSSAVFRNPRDLALMDDKAWTGLKVCGDWVFYLNLVRGGLVAYTPAATNYYRQHDNNTSVKAQSTDLYYREYEYVASQLVGLYDVKPAMLERLRDDLRSQWETSRPGLPLSQLDVLFDLDRIRASGAERKPNLMIIAYALAAGGGETFPLMLANLMKRNGYGVTVLNCHEQPTEPGVRGMLRRDIPLLQLKRLDHAPAVMEDMGVEVIHSHHAWVDITFASLLLGRKGPGHVVSMHGMYEMMPASQLQSIHSLMERGFHRIVYTAEKNLAPFSPEFRASKGFVRIDNALPLMEITPVNRAELGIGDDDFVLCLVSRAIPDKGWAEAIAAVQLAQTRIDRKIHLLLIGEGPEYDAQLAAAPIDGIHLLGFKKNIRDYFALADLGFLPSRFKGESYPLVLIDCLHSGTPLLASSVGEIHAMLVTDEGMAGKLFDLVDWQIPVDQVADLIVDLAHPDSSSFQAIQAHVPAAAHKFDPDQLFRKYDIVYGEALALSCASATKEYDK